MTTKDYVLYALKKAGGFVSGGEISETLGISRAAVHTAVKALRNDGYRIASSTNKGYRLAQSEERLVLGELLPGIGLERGRGVTVLDCVDSTNTYLRRLCASGHAAVGDCVIADEQTGGKGRLGRKFESQKGVGLYFSVRLEPKNVSPAELAEITAWGAVATAKAIEESCGIVCGIKWVNDLVCGNRKVCGILTEMSVEGETGRIDSVIMGIGINVNHMAGDFSPEVEPIAVSLRQITGKRQSRLKLCAALIRQIDRMREEFPQGRERVLAEYRARCSVIGKTVWVEKGGERQEAKALGIDDRFGLEVEYAGGTREILRGGEVSVRGFYGQK